ncbi:MAG: sulfite exporter TauE/SafE family protein [Saprospiraceae bacterium]|nr:MAG: ABC transporter permease [Candidatus Parvibacillus calidus]MCC7147998.1 sulfite exporter TauE/SafE family protein [Saprospiraceae bacterium]WKZ63906.1 MAG: sulfite exporter TauE/SafE family protein [Saprospiraceae bacterium]
MFQNITNKQISMTIIIVKSFLVIVLAWKLWEASKEGYQLSIDREFFTFLMIGFLAELVDGSLGMAYGVISSSFLIFFGVSPVVASAGVHTSEVFTTGVSGLSHLHFKNVDKGLFFRIVIPGVIGSLIGAIVLSKLVDGEIIQPFIAVYLLLVGIKLIAREMQGDKVHIKPLKSVPIIGFFGGALDAIGGGGWGPLVTSTILSRSASNAKHTIGTVNTAEFFVTFASTGIFMFLIGISFFNILLGLIIGGVVAAPLGAYFLKHVPHKVLMYVVGSVLIIVSAFSIYYYIFK